jgi:hypothetical protein
MKIYKLKVSLEGSKPPIWRKFQITADTDLQQLHHIIQTIMGWQDSHLHQFMINKNFYSSKDFFGEDSDDIDSSGITLEKLEAPLKGRFAYIYDFGDNWEHTLTIEVIEEANPAVLYPVCTAGKRATPPEDCGGIWGYADLLNTLASKKGKDYKEMKAWLEDYGYENFDPGFFSVELVNENLKKTFH